MMVKSVTSNQPNISKGNVEQLIQHILKAVKYRSVLEMPRNTIYCLIFGLFTNVYYKKILFNYYIYGTTLFLFGYTVILLSAEM